MSSETPTIKQLNAFQKTMENNGNVSKSMRQVGYSKNTAKNPKALTDSKGWETLMKKHIPDSLLAKKHKELLNKVEIINIGEVKTEQPETLAVSKALDMAYKLKRRYAEGGTNVNVNIIQGVEISFRE